jgi:hypothetical protein
MHCIPVEIMMVRLRPEYRVFDIERPRYRHEAVQQHAAIRHK